VDVNADYVGLGVGGKISAQQTAHSALTPYAGVGLGCYLVHASGGGESKTDTNIGFKVDAGVQFSQFLLELGYTDPGNIHADGDSKNVGGITLDAGVKF
jgi:opacity protein-like surface antigen